MVAISHSRVGVLLSFKLLLSKNGDLSNFDPGSAARLRTCSKRDFAGALLVLL
jgi:hypothetical protein